MAAATVTPELWVAVAALIMTILGAAGVVASKLVQGLRQFDALRRAVEANTKALSNGLPAEVRSHAVSIGELRGRVDGLEHIAARR